MGWGIRARASATSPSRSILLDVSADRLDFVNRVPARRRRLPTREPRRHSRSRPRLRARRGLRDALRRLRDHRRPDAPGAGRAAAGAGLSRLLALDFGEARCGCAVSDPTGTVVTPIGAVEQPDTRRGLGRIAAIVREREVDRVVVGLPLSLSGEEGAQARRTRAWADRLAERLDVPVVLHDERLTTRQAERAGGAADADSRAAAHLLEAYLAAAAAAGGGRL